MWHTMTGVPDSWWSRAGQVAFGCPLWLPLLLTVRHVVFLGFPRWLAHLLTGMLAGVVRWCPRWVGVSRGREGQRS